MRIRYLLVAAGLLMLGSAAAQGQVSWSGPINNVDGRVGAQYNGPGTKDVQIRRRPWFLGDTNLVLENYYIHDVWNQKGIDIGVTVNSNGTIWGYENIVVRNYDGARINRDESRFPGYHMDFLRIAGGNPQGRPTNVLLDDIYVHDGDALPIIIQDGNFGTVTLRDVQIERTSLNHVQIVAINVGHFNRVVVENSPGLRVALMGRPGSIDQVIIRNSPGAVVSDVTVNGRKSLAEIITENGSTLNSGGTGGPISVPEPATLSFLGLGSLLLMRHRRPQLASA